MSPNLNGRIGRLGAVAGAWPAGVWALAGADLGETSAGLLD